MTQASVETLERETDGASSREAAKIAFPVAWDALR
jgi:hypothetical protein